VDGSFCGHGREFIGGFQRAAPSQGSKVRAAMHRPPYLIGLMIHEVNNRASGLGSLKLLHCCHMKRFLAIILLALLPLQFSWAAVAGYCQHESEVTANHLGHHSHDHQAADQHEPVKDGASSAEAHHDCATCHLGCSVALASDLTTPTAAADRDYPFDYNVNPSLALTKRPERPQWPTLA
jgi:hypothetical protein